MVPPAPGATLTPDGQDDMRGVLLVAHGSRDPAWATPFESLRERIALQGTIVELAYLERMAPDMMSAAHNLAAQGCTRAVVIPLFLGQGGHVREDLPRLVAEAMRNNPSLALRLTAPIGEDARVLDAIAAVCIAERDATPAIGVTLHTAAVPSANRR